MCHFRVKNGPFVTNKIFFGTNNYYYFHLPTGSFHRAQFKKNLTANQELWGLPFLCPKWSICHKQVFFWKLLLFSSTYYPLSLGKILKNSSSGSRDMRMRRFWTQNGPFLQMRIFFHKTCFSYAHLHAKNQSQILLY